MKSIHLRMGSIKETLNLTLRFEGENGANIVRHTVFTVFADHT